MRTYKKIQGQEAVCKGSKNCSRSAEWMRIDSEDSSKNNPFCNKCKERSSQFHRLLNQAGKENMIAEMNDIRSPKEYREYAEWLMSLYRNGEINPGDLEYIFSIQFEAFDQFLLKNGFIDENLNIGENDDN